MSEQFIVTLPISDVQADVAGMPAAWLEKAIRCVGQPIALLRADDTQAVAVALWPINRAGCGICGRKIKPDNVAPLGKHCLSCALEEMHRNGLAKELKAAVEKAEALAAALAPAPQQEPRGVAFSTQAAEHPVKAELGMQMEFHGAAKLRAQSYSAPQPDNGGCVCGGCRRGYHADLIVPDDVWAQISPSAVEGEKGGGLLCPSCIMERIVDKGIWTAGHATGEPAPQDMERAVDVAASLLEIDFDGDEPYVRMPSIEAALLAAGRFLRVPEGGQPQRKFEDTFSAETVLMEHFFPDAVQPKERQP